MKREYESYWQILVWGTPKQMETWATFFFLSSGLRNSQESEFCPQPGVRASAISAWALQAVSSEATWYNPLCSHHGPFPSAARSTQTWHLGLGVLEGHSSKVRKCIKTNQWSLWTQHQWAKVNEDFTVENINHTWPRPLLDTSCLLRVGPALNKIPNRNNPMN